MRLSFTKGFPVDHLSYAGVVDHVSHMPFALPMQMSGNLCVGCRADCILANMCLYHLCMCFLVAAAMGSFGIPQADGFELCSARQDISM